MAESINILAFYTVLIVLAGAMPNLCVFKIACYHLIAFARPLTCPSLKSCYLSKICKSGLTKIKQDAKNHSLMQKWIERKGAEWEENVNCCKSEMPRQEPELSAGVPGCSEVWAELEGSTWSRAMCEPGIPGGEEDGVITKGFASF